MVRNIIFVVYPGFELLDLSGPAAVFSSANAIAKQPLYHIDILSVEHGLVQTSAGIAIQSSSLADRACDSRTCVLVVGAEKGPLIKATRDKQLNRWLAEQAPHCERFGSICSGTFLLQSAGLIESKVVTTHWSACDALSHWKGDDRVLEDALYHIDGSCWTSAGVTTGIDMTLEMIRRDHGSELMHSVAKYLVVYSQRPGKQSQFAEIQDMKPNEEEQFADLIIWLKSNVSRQISISQMSDFMCMSQRSFQRKFSAVFASSPAKFYERMRMEYARDFLLPKYSVARSANQLGYASVAAFRTSFEKQFGLSPSIYQKVR